MIDWSAVRYFKCREFDSPDLVGSGNRMDPFLVHTLDQIRAELGQPIKVTSGYRTAEHNTQVGGKPDSEHLLGQAADLACPTGNIRYRLIALAYKHGIERIGIGSTFIHLGVSQSLPHPTIWLY